MDTKTALIAAATEVLDRTGESGFSTRAVCEIAGVTAPTLYHHFGSADGLLNAVITEGFTQFLAHKKSEVLSDDPLVALRQGWDNYVRFAAERPQLYAAMAVRVLQGAHFPAADAARAILMQRVEAVAAQHALTADVQSAAELVWVSAHAAASLYVLAAQGSPNSAVVEALRERTLDSLLTSNESETSK
ncbi:TetR/AcrR family transcriptional regulator [Gordonia sp. CPCC 205515]|uniref:TetR/AcrR family transcriptional regulator n=1 Tax=Gordonia sp. CPCC 205515 TaxID=3140791 RepID=UPI003AF36A21